jgi:glutaredoxin 3
MTVTASSSESVAGFVQTALDASTIVVFSKIGCPYCDKLVSKLNELSIDFQEVVLDPSHADYDSMKTELISVSNHRTFPQLFIQKKCYGGYDVFMTMLATNQLHVLLKDCGIDVTVDF